MRHTITFRPLAGWPEPFTKSRVVSPFQATYSQNLKELDRELEAVNARKVHIMLDLLPTQIRLDGGLRADARPGHPGVMLTFHFAGQSPEEPVEFHCDTYTHWHDNLRAITKALNALRAVDRWGVTKKREQYAGFRLAKANGATSPPAPTARPGTLTKVVGGQAAPLFGSVAEAVRFLVFVADSRHWTVDYDNQAALETVIEMARQSVQSPAQQRLVEAAIELIKGQ